MRAIRAVRHVVQASAGRVNRFPDRPGNAGNAGKSRVEEHLKASGLSYTIIAPTSFMSNWDLPFFRPSILQGTLALPLNPNTVSSKSPRPTSAESPPSPSPTRGLEHTPNRARR